MGKINEGRVLMRLVDFINMSKQSAIVKRSISLYNTYMAEAFVRNRTRWAKCKSEISRSLWLPVPRVELVPTSTSRVNIS